MRILVDSDMVAGHSCQIKAEKSFQRALLALC